MVKEITSLGEYQQEICGPGLVVVDFFTTWCGPCKAVAPFIEQLVAKYPEVKFIKVDIEQNEDIAAPLAISSIPTFYFFVRGQKVDEMKGADPRSLEEKVIRFKVDVDPFKGGGHKLTSGDTDAPAISARDARLKAFAAMEGPRKAQAPTPAPIASKSNSSASGSGMGFSSGDVDEDEALSKAMQLSMAEPVSKASSSNSTASADEIAAAEAELEAEEVANAKPMEHFTEAPGHEWEEEMVPVPVNEDLLAQLLEMGFIDVRARKALVHGGSLEGAMNWITEHQDDADIDQPYMVRKSDTIPKPPLTEEEKREKAAAIQERIKQRRTERAKQEKEEEIRREKDRRERGQKMDETLEERQRMQRKREQEKIKKEKLDEKRERERLRAEIARDKEMRKKNKGVLPSVLGVDGYNPSIIQYNQPVESDSAAAATADSAADSVPAKRASADQSAGTSAASDSASTAQKKKTSTASASTAPASGASQDPAQRVEQAIQTIMRYRTGGDGGQALKLLVTFVRNVVENPDETKFRSINTDSNAFKNKLKPLVGPVILLKAVGFQMDDADGKLKFEGELPNPLLTETLQKLTAAEILYKQQNP